MSAGAGVMESAIAAAFGPGVRVRRHRPFPYATCHPIEEVVVDTGGPTEVVLVKRLDSSAVVDEAQGVVPEFLLDSARESEVYREVLPRAPLGTAHLYASDDDLLVIEKVRGVPLWEVGDLALWQEAARWLAHLHAARPHDGAPPRPSLLRYDRRYYDCWRDRVVANLAAGDRGRRRALARLAGVHEPLVEELLALPQTFIHGEFYPSNVLVSPDQRPPRICPVDWEMAGIGPALVDLAALTGGWDAGTAGVLAETYRETAAGLEETEDAFDRALDLCRLHLCLRWLGWAIGWRPPAEHVRDWLGDALRITDRLGLS